MLSGTFKTKQNKGQLRVYFNGDYECLNYRQQV